MMLTGDNGVLTQAGKAKEATEDSQTQEELQLAINALGMDYYSSGEIGQTLGEYILSNEEKLKEELGSDDVVVDATNKTITYKGILFGVADDGTISKKDGIALNKTELTLQIIDGAQTSENLVATLTNITGTITYESSNTGVATVDNSGKITTVGAGETTIIARCSGKTATCRVTVRTVVSISSISLSPTTGEVDEGSTLEVIATLNAGATEDVVWESSNETIAKVAPSETDSKKGIIRGIKTGGPVTITAKNTKGTITATFTLTRGKPSITTSRRLCAI